MTVKQLRTLAAKLIAIADEADKNNGGQLEQYYSVCSYSDTLEFQDNEENFQDLDE